MLAAAVTCQEHCSTKLSCTRQVHLGMQLQAHLCIIALRVYCSVRAQSLRLSLSCAAAAQAQLEEDMKRAAGEGQVHLDAQLQAEYYKIQEEAKSKTSRLRTDHEALRAAQVPGPPPAYLHEAHAQWESYTSQEEEPRYAAHASDRPLGGSPSGAPAAYHSYLHISQDGFWKGALAGLVFFCESACQMPHSVCALLRRQTRRR